MHASYALHGVLAGLVSATGQPLVITSSGLPFDVSSELTREACSAVKAHRQGPGKHDVQNGAISAEGQLAIMAGRYQVLWRFSSGGGQVALIVVSPASDSVMASAQLLNDIGAAVSRAFSGDLSPEKIKARYVEVYGRITVSLAYPGCHELASVILGQNVKEPRVLSDTSLQGRLRRDDLALQKLQVLDVDLSLKVGTELHHCVDCVGQLRPCATRATSLLCIDASSVPAFPLR